MAAKTYFYGLLSAIIVLVGAVGVTSAQNGSKSSTENLQVVEECDTCYVEPEINAPVYTYRIDTCPCHIYVNPYKEKSCPVVLKEVPVSGFYHFEVEAGYSGQSQQQEEYCLEINGRIQDTINDPNNDEGGYLWIDHGIQYLFEGCDTVIFHKGSQQPPEPNSVNFKTIKITRLPNMLPEPKYTQGLTNTVCWVKVPIADDHEPFCFDCLTGSPHEPLLLLQRSTVSDTDSHTFEGLDDGRKYGYYVEAYRWRDNLTLRSDIVYSTQDASPPTQAKINSLRAFQNEFAEICWQGACDSISGVTRYLILRCANDNIVTEVDTIAIIPSKIKTAGGDKVSYYCYKDLITDPSKTYRYRIDAIDSVKNSKAGKWSSTVVKLCSPKAKICPDPYQAPDGTFFVKGTKVTLCAEIPDTCTGNQIPDLVKFQAVRDSLKFFDSQWQSGRNFFDSCWRPIDDSNYYTFLFDTAFVNCGDSTVINDTSFVNGHKYYYRAQFKDVQENYSHWSDTLSAVQDCYPPDDISNLSVIPTFNADKTDGWMDIKWNSASDYGSGLKCYKIYRQIAGGNTTILESPDTTYKDHFNDIKENRIVCYWIGSIDNVGNERYTSKFHACARCQAPPTNVNLICEKVWEDVKYTTKDFTLLFVDFSNFDKKDISSLIVDVNGTEIENEVDSVIPIALPDIRTYKVKVKAILADKTQSIWSKADSIHKVKVLPDLSTTPKKVLWVERLNQNYPNPFNSSTLISYSLAKEAKVSINIYTIQGQRIMNLTDEIKRPGSYNVIWHGKDHNGIEVATGVYFYKLNIKVDNEPDIIKTRKMIFFK